MRKVKKKNNSFVDVETKSNVKCAFDRNHYINDCRVDCAACEIEAVENLVKVTCLRGNFTFANLFV